jgi:hypothetical protein
MFYFSSSALVHEKSRMFPQFLMVLLAIFLAWDLVGTSIKAKKEFNAEKVEAERKKLYGLWTNHKKNIIIFLSTVAFVALSQVIGFYICAFLFMVFLTYYLGIKNLKILIPAEAAFTVLLYFCFTVYLQLRLPTGLLI